MLCAHQLNAAGAAARGGGAPMTDPHAYVFSAATTSDAPKPSVTFGVPAGMWLASVCEMAWAAPRNSPVCHLAGDGPVKFGLAAAAQPGMHDAGVGIAGVLCFT
jgi:hypothetical protein